MAIELKLNRDAVNLEALQEELSIIAGEVVTVRFAAGEVSVSLPDALRDPQVNQARRAILQHDPEQLTARQRAERDRQQRRDQARRDLKGLDLDLSIYEGKDPLLLALARKIAWLERELALLTG
jgi:hypothetical protein